MIVLRTLWYIATIAFVTFYWSMACILAALAGVEYRKGGIYDRATRNWGRWLSAANGLTLRTEGLERLPADRPYVFIANHFSFCDIWALCAVLPDSVRFLAKKELFDIPIFGRAMRVARHIRIDRQNLQAAFGAYEEAGKVIREGISAIVYAEGTRSPDGKLQPFKKGPFVLAIASRVEVIPVWVGGAYQALPKGQLYVRPGVVTIRLGAPIPTSGFSYDARGALMERVRGEIVALAGGEAAAMNPAEARAV